MKAEAEIGLETYLARAPDPRKDELRAKWHLERYRFALTHQRSPHRVSDLGCGLGMGTTILGAETEEVYAFDINPQVVAYAAEHCTRDNVHFGVLDVESGPIPHSPYDLVCAFEIIEHLENPSRSLEHIKSSLAPGGRLVLSTPNGHEGTLGSHPYHYCEYSQEALERLLSQHFPRVEIYSQAVPSRRKEHDLRKAESSFLRTIRAIDFLRLRNLLPTAFARPILDRVTGIPLRERSEEIVRIVPGRHEDARWTVAVCSVAE
ncbi:MAG: class I SAM-dependent methyltransferase [bacterium]|nr:class I SAM-dependent methyltransferase [bacterium]